MYMSVVSMIFQYNSQGRLQPCYHQYREKSDAKWFKQQLLDDFWWYFSTGAAGWNTTFSVVFALPIGTEDNWYVFVSSPPVFVWYFFWNLVHMSWNFVLTTNDQDQISVLIFRIFLGSYIYWSFTFIFYYRNNFGGSSTLMHITFVPYNFFQSYFDSR